MGVLIVFLVAVLWSLVGIFVKIAAEMVDSNTITFLRFFIGAAILGVIYRVKYGPVRIRSDGRWIWIGIVGKSSNYFLENIGIFLSVSYGFIVGIPISYLLLLCISVFVLREAITRKDWAGALLSIAGVILMMLSGKSFGDMIAENGLANLLFVLSGVGAALHMLSQKKLVQQQMDPLIMNLSVFCWCAVITAIPLPFSFEYKGFHPGALLALLAMGAITGLSFYWFAHALRTVPLFLATVISNVNVLFTVLWGALFFAEPVGAQVIAGTLLFAAGMMIANWPRRKKLPAS